MNKKLNPLTPHDFGRHGEILIKRVNEIPKEAKLIEKGDSLIVGHSESGHNHVLTIEREQGVEIKMYELDGKVYLDLPVRGNLIHQKNIEKHDTQIFESGKYERLIRHSYSYGEKIFKRVVD